MGYGGSEKLMVVVFFACSLCSCVAAAADIEFGVYSSILRDSFGSDVEFAIGERSSIIFCPDNTCFSFEGKDIQGERLAKFAIIYLIYISRYNYYDIDMNGKGTFRDNSRGAVMSIVRENGEGCLDGSSLDVYCLLRNIDGNGDFIVEYSRYDERELVKFVDYPDEKGKKAPIRIPFDLQ